MAQTIQIRRGTGSAVPSSLAEGELAINVDSGKFYYGNGSAVSSDFRVDSITAENYVVSSSVTSYTFQSFSGSTDFGDDSGDIHERTGSLNVSGALNIDGNIASTNLTSGRLVKVNANGVLSDDPDFTVSGNDMSLGRDLTIGRNLIINAGTISNVSTTHITASGNVSASGIIITNDLRVNGGYKTTKTGTNAIAFTDEQGDDVIQFNNTISGQDSLLTLGDVGGAGNETKIEIDDNNSKVIINNTLEASNIRLSSTTDASVSSTAHAFQAGATNSTNIIIDNNEIMARNNGAVSGLHLNPDGGNITFNNSVSNKVIIGNGHVTASGDISASGTITAEHLTISDDITVGDDITMTGDNAAIFMGDSGNQYTFGVGQGGLVINSGVQNPASVNHFIVSASGGTTSGNARVGIGITPHSSAALNVSGAVKADSLAIGGDIACLDIAINGGNITTAVEVDGLLTAGANLRIGGAGSTSNNFISIDAQNGGDSSGGGITFYETGTYDVDSPQYGAKIVYNEDDDEFAIGTMHDNTFMRQIYMKRSFDRVYLADSVVIEGTTPALTLLDASTTVADGDVLGQIAFNNEDDDATTLNIKGVATEDHASGANGGSKLEFHVTPNTTSATALAATIDQNKTLNVSGSISSDNTILAGWHGSTTRIKILVSDFIPDDIGRPAMIDDTGSDRWLESHGTGILFASIPIPTGFKATHVRIYGSATSVMEVSEMDIDSKTVTSKGTGNIGTELAITNVTSDATNYLFIELAQASGEEVYGGYVTIAAV